MASSKQRLVMTLAGAGVPVDTVTMTGPTSAAVTYMAGATQAQLDQGTATLAAYDWTDAAEQTWKDGQNPTRSDLASAAAQAIADIDTYLPIADTATAAQVRAAVKTMAQDMRRVILRLIQLG